MSQYLWSDVTAELTGRNYEEAVRLMQRATTVPKNTKIDFYNDVSWPTLQWGET